jgi:hypothetical protein
MYYFFILFKLLKKKENVRLTVRNSLNLYILSVAENDTFFDFDSTLTLPTKYLLKLTKQLFLFLPTPF